MFYNTLTVFWMHRSNYCVPSRPSEAGCILLVFVTAHVPRAGSRTNKQLETVEYGTKPRKIDNMYGKRRLETSYESKCPCCNLIGLPRSNILTNLRRLQSHSFPQQSRAFFAQHNRIAIPGAYIESLHAIGPKKVLQDRGRPLCTWRSTCLTLNVMAVQRKPINRETIHISLPHSTWF